MVLIILVLKKPSNYEWLKHVANDSPIRKKDVEDIFNLTAGGLHSRIQKGNFPKAHYIAINKRRVPCRTYPNNLSFWKKSTILSEISKIEVLLLEKSV
ncbi:hypothetical protein UFOVP1516_28 [uncultured Caudovirales phage]|uniref:Uncharacterized protein n=1 Tax=uncultured Caudovirales phage TaxID=2100421 RepID=A0A6J7XAF2_9CAUD|nr:hypothetical protein UFOVP887_16 [uncultured Caudovirales phage]CAB5226796.1 hypothetical protein UFOVP1516_28 [uncultured Caudovirales phage]